MAHEPASSPLRRTRLTVRQRSFFVVVALCASVAWLPAPVLALEVRVNQLRTTGTRVWAGLEVRDLLQNGFLKLIREGRAIFVQLEADLWEDRRIFDRIVITIPPVTWRVDQDQEGRGVLLQDQDGGSQRHADIRQPLSLRVDLGPAARIDDAALYYLHARMTAATVDERDIEQAGEAIFGDERSARGVAGLGRFVFRTLLRMGKYFESATVDVTSRRVAGRDIRTGAF